MTQIAFSKAIGVSQGYINSVIKGEKSLSHRVIVGITSGGWNSNINWLLTGEGDMFLSRKDVPGDRLSVVEEPGMPEYERGKGLRVGELPEVILNLQAEVDDLRGRVAALEEMCRRIVATYKALDAPEGK